eukprot:TRINITY_DN4736_c0_g1_i2.p1 TRINITY_DN4736_c0_g1~~TRINITY_DN4736_c0_g1_i2.p1  ORF type:complete len:221 (+),score=42.29 TRINITY_DN4736_c0_g1_i2:105-767(+)
MVCFFSLTFVIVVLLVGKTGLVLAFVSNHFVEEYDPDIEDAYRKIITLKEGGEEIMLDILDIKDTAGRHWYHLWASHAFVCVYDVTSRSSIEDIIEWPKLIVEKRKERATYTNGSRREKKVSSRDKRMMMGEPPPIMIVGNKCECASTDRQVTTKEGQELASSMGALFIETSAKTFHNVSEAFQQLGMEIIRHQAKEKEKDKEREGIMKMKKKGHDCVIV